MTARAYYARYLAALRREADYNGAAFSESVLTGVEYGDLMPNVLAADTAAAWEAWLRHDVRAAAVYAARRWWAREADRERTRLTWQLREADARWHGVVMPWYEAGCIGASSRHPAVMAGRDIQQRIDAAASAWDADWRAALLALERAYTQRTQNAALAEAA